MRLARNVLTIAAADSPPVKSVKLLWKVLCRLDRVLFGRISVPSHDIISITNFCDVTNYFVNDKLVVVPVVCLTFFSPRELSCVVVVTIGAVFFLKVRYIGCAVNTDHMFIASLRYCEGAVLYCESFLRPRYFGKGPILRRWRDSFGFGREYTLRRFANAGAC